MASVNIRTLWRKTKRSSVAILQRRTEDRECSYWTILAQEYWQLLMCILLCTNEHIWDCKPCMAWILIVKDYLIVDPQWQLSTQPSPNLTASPCHTKILIGHSNMSKMSLIINKIKSHKLIFSYLMYDMKWESKTGTCIFLL